MPVRIGTSGWSYPHWRGQFFPPGLPTREELEYISQAFKTVEINRSFYSLLSPNTCRSWYAQTPARFVFSLKGSRFITHQKKLRDARQALANFFASGPLALREKLGPIVWQFPDTFRYDEERLSEFIAQLPRTTVEAAALARSHDHRLKHGVSLEEGPARRIRHAFEPRHESFMTPSFAALTRKHGVAIVAADSASWPLIEEVTSDFVYVRLHGGVQTYASDYSRRELSRWARRVTAFARGQTPKDAARISSQPPVKRKRRDVYVYFDNDGHAHAPRNALSLVRLCEDA